MKVVVGLGNPGKKYARTRHNAGFLVLDWFLETHHLSQATGQKKFNSEVFEIHNFSSLSPVLKDEVEGNLLLLIKPQTFMNASGNAVREICNFYKLDIKNELLVIHDDVDLPLGVIRTNCNSSSAGHLGVQHVIDSLGTQNFWRIRIGVESRNSRADEPTEVFVLQNFTDNELAKLKAEVFPKVQLEIEKFIQN